MQTLTLNELYKRLVESAAEDKTQEELEKIRKGEYDTHGLECLLNPEKYAPVWHIGECECREEECSGIAACIFDAIARDEKGNFHIDIDACVGCSACIEACEFEKLTGSKDILPVLNAVKNSKGPVYALIAPAFIGQFSSAVTPGMLRSAFKRIGFQGMVEVALFADILTLKEALEYDRIIHDVKDFVLTSCCCPIWLAMIRKVYREYLPHLPGSVSPMIACGRAIKHLEPDAVTVFIGPCIAKKAEARDEDIADAIDFVLTFKEIQDVFDAFQIDLNKMEDDPRDHSSMSGRIYARTGGVSEAVQKTVERLQLRNPIPVRAIQADGVPACREMMNRLKEGKIDANFLEGMGCVGGCVGGPRAVIDREAGRDNVNQYGELAAYETPVDNPYVLDMLKQLGFNTVESLLDDGSMFARQF